MTQPLLLSWVAAMSVMATVGVLLRAAALSRAPQRRAGLLQPALPPSPSRSMAFVDSVGRVILKRIHPSSGDPHPEQARRMGGAGLAALAALLIAGPLAAGAVGALMVWTPAAVEKRRAKKWIDGFTGDLPEVVDLFSLALGSGLNVSLAVAAVGRRASGALAAELSRVAGETGRGRRLSDSLEELPVRCGESVRPLATLLAAGERYGVPLVESLERLAVEVRANERRRAEEAARRLPVKMLFPLVVCILPAFGLLTLGPMLVTSFPSLTF